MSNIYITVEGDDIFQLPKEVQVRGASKSTGRPLLHRLAANMANLSAAAAQQEVVEQMAKDMHIRRFHAKGRFPSFIQNQIKILPGPASAADYPNISIRLEVDPWAKSNREGVPLVLDVLESGGTREPRPGKKQFVIPTDEAREGGAFAGKVKPHHTMSRIAPKLITIRAAEARGRKPRPPRVYKKVTHIYAKRKTRPSVIFRYEPNKPRPTVLYTFHKRLKMPKKFKFFGVAINAIGRDKNINVRYLIDNLGNVQANIKARYKYYTLKRGG